MNRLQKKCLLGSAAMHGLLVVVFLFGSAFLSRKPNQPSAPVLTFIPDILTDKQMSGGGNPAANPAPAPAPASTPKPPTPVVKPQPLPPAPLPEPPKVRETAKHKEPEVKDNGDEPVPIKKVKDSAKNISKIPTNVVKHSSMVDLAAVRAQQREREQYEQQMRAYSEYQGRLAAVAGTIGQTVSGLGNSLSGTGVSIESFGPGGGGPTYANYFQWVMTVYDNAWKLSDDVVGDDATVKARITIARDGTVLSARPVSPSPNSSLNRSVQQVLSAVKSVHRAFPEGAKEDQRTFTINFSLKAKRQTG